MPPLLLGTRRRATTVRRGRHITSGAATIAKGADSVGDTLHRPDGQAPPPERAQNRAQNLEETLGSPGFGSWGGYVTSREKDPALRGTKRYELYAENLANCDLVATGVAFFLDLLSKPEWTFEPADDSAEARKVAEFITEVMRDLASPLRRTVKRGGLFRFYGFSIHEFTTKRRDDGRLGLLDIEVRPQLTIERWDTDKFGVVHGLWQTNQTSFKETYLPRVKLLHFLDDSLSDSPEGFGVFRSLVPAVKRLHAYERLEGLGFEIDLRGIPLLRAPFKEIEDNAQATRAEKDAAIQGIRDFAEGHVKARDLALLLDSACYQNPDGSLSSIQKWGAELIQGGASSTEAIGAAIQRVQLGIARRLNITHMMLGGSGGGAFALSEDQSINFGLTVDSTLGEMTATIERELVLPLVLLNGWDRRLCPKVKTSKMQWRTIQELAAFVRDMATAGILLETEDDVVGDMFEFAGLRRPTMFAKPEPMDAGLIPGKGGGSPFGGKPKAKDEDTADDEGDAR